MGEVRSSGCVDARIRAFGPVENIHPVDKCVGVSSRFSQAILA